MGEQRMQKFIRFGKAAVPLFARQANLPNLASSSKGYLNTYKILIFV
jgi:hypothetical protein